MKYLVSFYSYTVPAANTSPSGLYSGIVACEIMSLDGCCKSLSYCFIGIPKRMEKIIHLESVIVYQKVYSVGHHWDVDEWMAGNLQVVLSPLSSGIVILQIAFRASK